MQWRKVECAGTTSTAPDNCTRLPVHPISPLHDRIRALPPLNRQLNSATQPFREFPVFNNWDVVAKGWYAAMPAADLRVGAVRAVEMCGQRVVLWRGQDGRVRATDAFCPHMGTDLAIGTVTGNELQCRFHQWRFDGSGACVHIPVGGDPPRNARLQSYATDERYGLLWVWPDASAPTPMADFPDWDGAPVQFRVGIAYERPCHHHVTMINGIDPQHLRTVHDIHIDMQLAVDESSAGRIVDYTLSGDFPDTTLRERFGRWLLGERYQYSMRYVDGTVGMLSVNQGTRLFGTGPELPSAHMIFAYTPIAPGRTRVQPVYIARRRGGVLGRMVAASLLAAMKWGFYVLRDEDGQIYDNIRFSPTALLPMDAPVSRYIAWVNKLEPSIWSRKVQE